MDKRDIEAAAELGLTEAAKRVRPRRGILFTTFAYYRTGGAICNLPREMPVEAVSSGAGGIESAAEPIDEWLARRQQ